MVKSFPRSVVEIRNFDGSCEPFDAMALQTRLIGSFLAAGRGDSSFMAEDIALAVEYTLSHVERPEPVFGRGELDAAVIRLLEEACLPDVAKIFRKGLAETSLLVSAYPATLSDLLSRVGPDSFTGLCASVIYGSSDTVVYIVSVYFSSVGIQRTRWALPCAFAVMLFCVFFSCFLLPRSSR